MWKKNITIRGGEGGSAASKLPNELFWKLCLCFAWNLELNHIQHFCTYQWFYACKFVIIFSNSSKNIKMETEHIL